jgi:hypothetical protein
MTVQITGTLKDPMGNLAIGIKIRVTAQDTTTVLFAQVGEVITGEDGSYDFTIGDGKYVLEVLFTDTLIEVAYLDIDVGTLTGPMSLEQLVTDGSYCVPELPPCYVEPV